MSIKLEIVERRVKVDKMLKREFMTPMVRDKSDIEAGEREESRIIGGMH